MAKKVSKNAQKELNLLLANYEMLKKSQTEAELRGKQDSVKLINMAKQDVIEQIRKIDQNTADKLLEDEKTSNSVYQNNDMFNESVAENYEADDLTDDVTKLLTNNGNYASAPNVSDEIELINSDVQYDIISLPSNGQCYRSKIDRVPVAYLTAYDENLITSPNLYKDGLIIDFLLKHKVLNKKMDLSELCRGDVDAITLFLRATSYGPEFPIIVKDPETNEDIETVVDLSTLKFKEFNLIGDEDGYFDFQLPVSKDNVKFRFLTRKDERVLKMLGSIEDYGVKSNLVKTNVQVLTDIIKSDNLISGKDKQEYVNDLNKILTITKLYDDKSNHPYSKMITNRLELSIMAINGNYDKSYISKYVRNMGAKDSLMLRRYMLENEPGVDFTIEVNRPKSLGGGSFKTFLEWDDSIFLNIA